MKLFSFVLSFALASLQSTSALDASQLELILKVCESVPQACLEYGVTIARIEAKKELKGIEKAECSTVGDVRDALLTGKLKDVKLPKDSIIIIANKTTFTITTTAITTTTTASAAPAFLFIIPSALAQASSFSITFSTTSSPIT